MLKKRFLAMLLVMAMVLSLVPTTVGAEDETPKGGTGVDGYDDADHDVFLDKYLTPDGEGTYTLELDAYTLAKVETQITREPVDITIVMDVSGSMDYSDMGTRTETTIDLYPHAYTQAVTHQEQDHQFYHKLSNGTLHEVELIYISDYSGRIYEYQPSSNQYSPITSNYSAVDIGAFVCKDESCLSSGQQKYCTAANGHVDKTFTGYFVCDGTEGNMSYNPDGLGVYWESAYDWARYPNSLEEAYSMYQAGYAFKHRAQDGSYHNVEIDRRLNFTGRMYFYNVYGKTYTYKALTSQDVYYYICDDESCLLNGNHRYQLRNTSGSTTYASLDGYGYCDTGTASDSGNGFFNDAFLYWHTDKISRMDAMRDSVNDFIARINAANQEGDGYHAESDQHRIGLVKFAGSYFPDKTTGNDFYDNSPLEIESITYYDDKDGNTCYVDEQFGEVFYYYTNTSTVAINFSCMYNCAQTLSSAQYVNSSTLSDLQTTVSGLIAGGSTQANYGIQLADEIVTANKQTNPERQQIVLFFTDGEPTTGSTFEKAVADDAISYANTLKESGATVYAINISPSGSASTDMTNYMNRVSSNYEGVSDMTTAASPVAEGYYKDVANAQELADLFADIQTEVIGGDLTAAADLRDYMADGVLITDSSVVTAYISDYEGNNTWGIDHVVQIWQNGRNTRDHQVQITVDREKGLVSVTGFDYAAYGINENPLNGAKLKITISGIEVTEGAAVTADGKVYTNKYPESGIYPSVTATKPTDEFPRPYIPTEVANALSLDKKAELTDNGTVTIDLEAYATGQTVVTAARNPVDITIVMDLSTSMLGDDWGTRSTADWEQYNYNCEAIPNFLDNGAKFGHMTPTGEIHEVEIVPLTNFSGGAYVAQTAYNTPFSLSSQNIYAYKCLHDECKVSYTSNGTEYLGYPYRIKNKAGNATYDVTEYYSFSASSTDAHFFPESLRVFYTTVNISRIAGMKKAVNDFIAATAKANEGVEASQQHRIALVKFASDYFPQKKDGNDFYCYFSGNYSGLNDYLYTSESNERYYVNICGRHIHEVIDKSSDKSTILRLSAEINCAQILSYAQNVTGVKSKELQSLVNIMIASGVTMSHYGMLLAEDVVTTNKAESGRDQIVLFFTDGKPESGNSNIDDGFNEDYADQAIAYAKKLKDAGAKVYTVSLMKESDETTDMKTFMQYASSNYPDATSLTDGGTGDNDKGYHLLASSIEDLNKIFDNITQLTQSSNIELDAAADLRDYLAEGFRLTENSVITVQTVKYAGKVGISRTWENPQTQHIHYCSNGTTSNGNGYTVTANMDTGAISVTGFDYKTNYVGANSDGSPRGYKLKVTITGIEATDEAIAVAKSNGNMAPTNLDTSGVYPSTSPTATPAGTFITPEIMLTSKIYVLDYAKEASLAAADWNASQANHLDADGMNFFDSVRDRIDEKYGMVQRKIVNNAYNNKQLYYTPQTMLWDGYDSFYSFGKQEDELTNLWSKISVLPANSVYYEDTFLTTDDSSTVGITYTGNWTVANTDDNHDSNTEDENGDVHGWIEDLGDDTGFSDGSAHGITLADPNDIATAKFKFTGTGVDVYTYTDITSGIVQAALMKVGENDAMTLVKVHIIDNLAVSGEYYQIPTLSFKDLEYGTYMVSLSVASAVAVDEDNKTVEGQYRSTYYLDGIRVYNPIQNLENDETVKEGYGNELGAIFQEVREKLLDASTFNPSTMNEVSGSVFIDLNGKLDGNGAEGDTTDDMSLEEAMGVYNDYGPKHEVYLAPNQGIAFKVDAPDDAKFFLGIKSPAPEVGASQVKLTNAADASNVKIEHSSDLYYEVQPNADGYIFVMNTGDTLISITKLRSTGTSTGIVTANATEMAAYISSFRSLPVVDYTEDPLPPENPTQEPSLWDILAQIQKLLEGLFGSLDGWFN